MYDGIEVDTISLGDADCAVVTQWHNSCPHRVLIDGGSGADAATVIDFLHSRGYTELWAALCTHLHNDHARGLIKIARNNSITISNGWMHDIRAHVRADVLRRACADDGVRQVVETTTELAAAFDGRHIPRQEPFAGNMIAGWPHMTVLGPSLQFYDRIIADFTNVEPPARPTSGLALALAAQNARTPFARIPAPPGNTSLSALFSRMSPAEIAPFPGNTSLAALLSRPPSPNSPCLKGLFPTEYSEAL
jgi:hypothetical protein